MQQQHAAPGGGGTTQQDDGCHASGDVSSMDMVGHAWEVAVYAFWYACWKALSGVLNTGCDTGMSEGCGAGFCMVQLSKSATRCRFFFALFLTCDAGIATAGSTWQTQQQYIIQRLLGLSECLFDCQLFVSAWV
jgi:hypothetical protein